MESSLFGAPRSDRHLVHIFFTNIAVI